MAQLVDVVVDTGGQQGVASTVEVSSPSGAAPTPAARSAKAKAEPTGPLAFVPDTHSVQGGGRALKDSTREKISAILKAHAEDSAPPEDEEEPSESPEVESVADAAGESAEEPDDEVIDAAATPSTPAAKAKVAPPSEFEERLKELEGVTERQRAALERYEAQLAEARKSTDEALEKRAALVEQAEQEYLSDPIKALYKYVAASLGHDDPDHEDVKKEVTDLWLDLTSHSGGVTQDPAHLAKRQSDRTRREWEREKKGRAASGKKDAETAAQREREQQVNSIIGDIDGRLKTDAEKYPHLTALAPLLEGRTPGQVIYDLVAQGIKRGDFKADEPDDVLIAKAAKAAETYYTKRADPIRAAITKPTSTAKPAAVEKTAPAAQVEREKPRTSKEARVTNADASVAPATPPAQKPAPKAIPLSDDEKRRKHALRHLRAQR
jgi:uncharacterized coiled-coil protein SlyX